MSQPNYLRTQDKAFTNIFDRLDVGGDIYCDTLHYTTLDPAPSGTTKWIDSGNNIYNYNSGNVGIGTSTPTQKLDVNGNILSSGNITCNQLNYTTLNPPIPALNSKWSDAVNGIYRNSSVGVNTSGALNPYSLWVNGDAKVQTNLSVQSLTDLTAINTTSSFQYYQDYYTASFGGFWTTGAKTTRVSISRIGQMCFMYMKGIISTDSHANGVIQSDPFISKSKYFPFYDPAFTLNKNYHPISIIVNSNTFKTEAVMGSCKFTDGGGGLMRITIGCRSEANNWGSTGTGSQNGFYDLYLSWNIDYGSNF